MPKLRRTRPRRPTRAQARRLRARDVRAAREGEKKPGKGHEKHDDFLAKVQGLIKEGVRAKEKDPIERMSKPRHRADDLRERKQRAEETARRAAPQAPAGRVAEQRYEDDPSRFRLPKSVGVCGSVDGFRRSGDRCP
ncbi:hypothetical protein [Amycolatopsis sp. MtRt-6]|uniref:hypothetical protein n=1 Tax=Amycolatopsis sp. MtRt-6 TaxID=2792782 RepID=UPI001A90AFDD|nr:hypothetical protein [Amycolatopsis sp. MtRt-6]